MDRGRAAIIAVEPSHEPGDGATIGAAGLHAIIERVAETIDRLLPRRARLPMAALAAVEAERRGARRHADGELLDPGRWLLDRMQLRVFRMRRRAVVAFEVVLDRQLPVRRDRLGFAISDPGIGP